MNTKTKLRNCLNCGHRVGRMCVRTGYSWDIQRQYPSDTCDENLSGWFPAPPTPAKRGLLTRLLDFIAPPARPLPETPRGRSLTLLEAMIDSLNKGDDAAYIASVEPLNQLAAELIADIADNGKARQ